MKRTLEEAIAHLKTPEGQRKIDEAMEKYKKDAKVSRESMRMDWRCTCHEGGGCIHHTVYGPPV